MSNVGEYIKSLRTQKGMTQEELGSLVGVKKAAVQKWESGLVQNLKRNTIKQLAEIFNVSPVSFVNDTSETANVAAIFAGNIYSIPVYATVSAGFGAYADNCVIEYIPIALSCPAQAADTIAVKVKGDSMSPKIEEGDRIVVHKQTSVDSGDIAVVLLDGEEALVKKIKYGETWIELHSINPYYPVRRFDGEDVTRLRVLGKVVGSYKSF